jgi:hypothetical protein
MSMEGPERFTGGCLSGSVRIVASGRPYRVGVRHCLDCRTHDGAFFRASRKPCCARSRRRPARKRCDALEGRTPCIRPATAAGDDERSAPDGSWRIRVPSAPPTTLEFQGLPEEMVRGPSSSDRSPFSRFRRLVKLAAVQTRPGASDVGHAPCRGPTEARSLARSFHRTVCVRAWIRPGRGSP